MQHPIFKSKKAGIAIFASAMAFVSVKSGFTEAQIGLVLGPLVAYLPVEMFTDRARAHANSAPAELYNVPKVEGKP